LSGVLRMARTVYVDTSRTASRTADGKRKKRKPHYVYDGEKVFEVNKLTKLKDVDEVYIDVLFPEIYEEVLELLKRGIKVYLLKNPSILKKLRIENNLRKSDENDSVLLSKISKDGFRALTIQEMEKRVELKPWINKYELLSKRVKVLKLWIKNDGYDYKLRDSVRLMEKDKEEVARKIIEILSNDTIYREACRLLGFKDSVEVAILTTELPLHLPLNILKKFVGLTPNRNKGKYDHRIRTHLSQLATNIYINVKQWKDKLESPEEFKKIVNFLPRERAIYKLQSRILKMFRKAYFLANSQTINNPIGR